ILHAENMFQVRSVAGIIEFRGMRILFMDRPGNQSLDLLLFQRLNSAGQGPDGIFASCIRKLTWCNAYLFFPAVKNIDLLMIDTSKILDALVIEIDLRHRFPVKI